MLCPYLVHSATVLTSTAKAYAIMPFVWSIGTIVGPAIGGYFAEPVDNFPSVFPRNGLFDSFPYLLPNLLCASLLLASMIAAYFFLLETHPDMQPWSTKEDLDHTSAVTPLIPASGAMANAPADISTESYGTFDAVTIIENPRDQSKPSSRSSSPRRAKVFTKNVVMLTVALGMCVYAPISPVRHLTNMMKQLHLPLNDV